MLIPYVVAFLVLAFMVGTLFWLRRNRDVSKKFDRFNAGLAGNPRWQSFEVLVGGLFLMATALLKRTDDGQGRMPLVRSDQPGHVLLAIAAYLIIVGLIFLVRPMHISKLFVGLGMSCLGVFLLLSAAMVHWGGGRLSSLYGDGVNDIFSKAPWILALIAFVIGTAGLTSVRQYLRERATTKEILGQSARNDHP